MAFEIDIRPELHYPQLERCPDSVQHNFRDAFETLKTASVSDIKNVDFDFLERIAGRSEYQIVSTTDTERYIVVFEIIEKSDSRDRVRVLRIGEENELLD